jgi:hypothetical protein
MQVIPCRPAPWPSVVNAVSIASDLTDSEAIRSIFQAFSASVTIEIGTLAHLSSLLAFWGLQPGRQSRPSGNSKTKRSREQEKRQGGEGRGRGEGRGVVRKGRYEKQLRLEQLLLLLLL